MIESANEVSETLLFGPFFVRVSEVTTCLEISIYRTLTDDREDLPRSRGSHSRISARGIVSHSQSSSRLFERVRRARTANPYWVQRCTTELSNMSVISLEQ